MPATCLGEPRLIGAPWIFARNLNVLANFTKPRFDIVSLAENFLARSSKWYPRKVSSEDDGSIPACIALSVGNERSVVRGW
ncbi:hypothetical protein [Mesorhizobium erdmanii]|uniref:hypothetical protein n=1 Tax=Mesorhizobium erdmanii TaxID=1777866 RepID=UPI0012DB5A0D|nr:MULTISPECIES: hypothetical protein [Mesorhizobium]